MIKFTEAEPAKPKQATPKAAAADTAKSAPTPAPVAGGAGTTAAAKRKKAAPV
jgi:hypothetical protein